MKLLFVHDHIFKRTGQLLWSTQLPYSTLSRYLEVFDEVTVFARCEDVDKCEGHSVASGANVRFVFGESVANVSSFFGARRTVTAVLSKLVAEHEAIVLRLPSEFGLLAAKAATEAGRDYAVEVVGCAWDALWNYGSTRAKIYAPALFARTKKAVALASFASYVTDRYLQSRYPPGPSTIAEAISDVQIGTLRDRVEIQLRGEKPISRPTLGTIGSLKTKYKGVHTAIEAIAQLKQRGIIAEYRVLGGGDPRPYIGLAERCGVAKQVSFDGVLPPGEAVVQWLDCLDVYIQPSLTEGLPRALVEALSRGCPAVASDVGGMPELLHPEMLFRPQHASELASILHRLLTDQSLRNRESVANSETACRFVSEHLDAKRRKYLHSVRNRASAKHLRGELE